MTPIAFIEDDELYRQLLVAVATSSGRYRVVGAYASTREALARLPDDGAALVVIDVNLVGHSGISAIARLHERWPATRCVILTSSELDRDVFAALEAGAVGYLLKSDPPAQILAGLDEAVAGGAPLSRAIARRVLRTFARPSVPAGERALTAREREILDKLAGGQTYKEIATALGISTATVKNHLSRLYGKLGVRSRTEAVVKWLRR